MQRPGFYFCICPDSGLIKEHVAGLLDVHRPGGGATWERHTYWGDEELPQTFWEHLTLQGLFGVPRVLVLRNAQNVPAANWKKLSAALGTPNEKTWLILCLEVAWEKGQPKIPAHLAKLRCLAFADKQGWVWRSGGLDERGIRKFVQQRAKALGLSFGEGALEALCASVPPDAAAVESEMQKVRLAAADGVVTVAMTGSADYVPESNIFSFIRFLQAGNAAAAWRELHRGQREGDGMLFPFLALLLREARILWQIQAGEQVRMHPSDVQSKEKLAAKLGFSGLSKLFECIMRAEWHVKSGQRSPDQALEALAADLLELFRPVSGR